jgi:hypothetical protein
MRLLAQRLYFNPIQYDIRYQYVYGAWPWACRHLIIAFKLVRREDFPLSTRIICKPFPSTHYLLHKATPAVGSGYLIVSETPEALEGQ